MAGTWYRNWDLALPEFAETCMRWGKPVDIDEMLVAWDRDCPDVAVTGIWVDFAALMVHGRLADGRVRFYDWCTLHSCWEDERCPRRGGAGKGGTGPGG